MFLAPVHLNNTLLPQSSVILMCVWLIRHNLWGSLRPQALDGIVSSVKEVQLYYAT